MHLVIVERNQFLRLDSRPRRQHLLVDGLKRGCVFCGEDVVVRLAHDLAARDVKQLLVAAIHQDVAPLQVLHVDDRGRFVDDRLQALVAGGYRVLGVPAFDVLLLQLVDQRCVLGDRRPEPLGHLVELVGQQVQFMAANDGNTQGTYQPNWQIDSVRVTQGATQPSAFSVTATAVPGPVFYQWYRDDGSGFQVIAGANGSTYSLLPACSDNGAKFRVNIYTPGALAVWGSLPTFEDRIGTFKPGTAGTLSRGVLSKLTSVPTSVRELT